METIEIRFPASRSAGEVSALIYRPEDTRALLVLGHGAGAGMRHPFMEGVARQLAAHRIATFRYQFPYMENGKKRPDPAPILMKTVRSAVATAMEYTSNLPIFVGGKSLGGRMTSQAQVKEPLPGVQGIIFFGFPLHAPGRPSSERGEHLKAIDLPMLFLQGTRDNLAHLDYIRPLCNQLGTRATLHIIDGGDHSFHLPKSMGRSDAEVRDELAKVCAEWFGRFASPE